MRFTSGAHVSNPEYSPEEGADVNAHDHVHANESGAQIPEMLCQQTQIFLSVVCRRRYPWYLSFVRVLAKLGHHCLESCSVTTRGHWCLESCFCSTMRGLRCFVTMPGRCCVVTVYGRCLWWRTLSRLSCCPQRGCILLGRAVGSQATSGPTAECYG